MKMQFLCTRHRTWLSADPAAALFTWLQCYEQGLRLERQHRDDLAIRQAGCALETADLLLGARAGGDRDDITRLTHSALLLARLFRRQHAYDLASDAVHSAISSLEQVLAAGVHAAAARAACAQLAPMTGSAAELEGSGHGGSARQLH